MHPFLVGVLEGAAAVQKAPAKQSTPQTVRRGPAKTPGSGLKIFANGKLTPQAEVALGSLGGAALLGILWATGLLSKIPALTHKTRGDHATYFTSGFLVASTVAVAARTASYLRLTKALQFGGSYTRFPARLHIEDESLDHHRPAGVLKPQEYQEFPLTRRDKLSAYADRLVFELPSKISVLGLPIGQNIAIRGYFDDQEGHHTVTRSYTPVPNNKDLGRLELVIKMYPDGQLTGKYLSGLQIGDKVEFCGPKGATRYRKGMSKNLGMIYGGTGNTPMYQIIRAICEDKTDDTVISLIFANKSPADILLQIQFERLQKLAPKKFRLTYVIDKAVPGWTGEVGFVNKKMIQEKLPRPDRDTKILLCGPPGMVNASKKTLVELGFEAPGAVSKMSDQIFLF